MSKSHWEDVYQRKDSRETSWFRPHLDVSMELLRQAGLSPASRVIDIGGGASTLVDDLLEFGASAITVLDVSAEALRVAQLRLGDAAKRVQWRVESLLDAQFEHGQFDFWHDRAVLHFLTAPIDAQRYAEQAAHAVAAGGYAVIGGFAPDGPERCSGLAVARRSALQIASLFEPGFRLVDQRSELHQTPANTPQSFCYALLRRE